MSGDKIESLRGWRRFQFDRPFAAAGVWALVAGVIAFGKMDDWRAGVGFAVVGYLAVLVILLLSRRKFGSFEASEEHLRAKTTKRGRA